MVDAIGYFSADATSGAAALRAQEALFYRHCDATGLRAVATFSDVLPGPRTGFSRLVRYLEWAKPGVLVVVECLERLGATPTESIRRILEIEALGARPGTITDEQPDLLAAVLATDATRKTNALPGKAREQLQQKAMQAHGLGKPPFGYHIGADGRFEVVPDEANVVQLIYRLYLTEQKGLRLIAGHLNEQGITTRRGARWSVVTVRDILRNPVYQGTYSRYGVFVSGSHPALVSRETFRRAQERRKNAASERSVSQEVSFALSGLAYCGYCGSRMVGATRHQSWTRKDRTRMRAVYRYYRCGSRVNQSMCSYHTHRADDLEAAVATDVAGYFVRAGDEGGAARFHMARTWALREGLTPYVKDALAGRSTTEALRQVAAELLNAARAAVPAVITADGAGAPDWWSTASPAVQQAILQGLAQRVTVFDDHQETEVRDPLDGAGQ